jgi:hypothetical protein
MAAQVLPGAGAAVMRRGGFRPGPYAGDYAFSECTGGNWTALCSGRSPLTSNVSMTWVCCIWPFRKRESQERGKMKNAPPYTPASVYNQLKLRKVIELN